MRRLKADLHTHTADDPSDRLEYSTEELIDAASDCGIEVLAVTCHDEVVYTDSLAEYAAQRGILLIPGVERFIEGKHVVILNPDARLAEASTFSELRCNARQDAAVIAPHPYYPTASSLRGKLTKHADVFDAVEYSSLYSATLNPNIWARRAAARLGLPLVGTSDVHKFPYVDSTVTWIEAEFARESVIDAVRKGRVHLETRPRSPFQTASAVFNVVRGKVQHALGQGT